MAVQVAKPPERVDAGSVSVAPVDPDAVAAHRRDLQGLDVTWYRFGVEPLGSRPLVDALRTPAGQTQGAHFIPALEAVLPRDRETAGARLANLRGCDLRFAGVHGEGV